MKFPSAITSFTKRLTRVGRRAPIRILVHPMREWVTCLTITVLSTCILFAFLGLDFYIQFTSVDSPVIVDSSVPKYREGDAESIIKYYEGKESLFNNLREDKVVAMELMITETVSTTSPQTPRVAEESVPQ